MASIPVSGKRGWESGRREIDVEIGNAADDDGKLDGIAEHADPMQPARRLGVAGNAGTEFGIHPWDEPAA